MTSVSEMIGLEGAQSQAHTARALDERLRKSASVGRPC